MSTQPFKLGLVVLSLIVLMSVINSTCGLGMSFGTTPRMVNSKLQSTTDKCCLPRKISLQGKIMQVSFNGNQTNTYFSTWSIDNDLDNGKARTDIFNVNLAPNTTTISYRNNGDLTYSYTIVWGQTCFCVKTKADWSNNYCTDGPQLEQSNIGFNKAIKYGIDTTFNNDKYYHANYYWTIPTAPVDNNESCIFVSNVQAIVTPEGSLSKNIQFYGANTQVDPKKFTIPSMCPPENLCRNG